MTTQNDTSLELDDIQAGALMPRPNPYAGAYLPLRIDDRRAGRELLRRLIPAARPVSSLDPARPVSLGVATQLRRARGARRAGRSRSPASRPSSSRAWPRAPTDLGDVGENAPEHWEAPLGSTDVHVVLAALAPDTSLIEALVALAARRPARPARRHRRSGAGRARAARRSATQFGFKDGISQPAVEGSGIPGSNPHEAPLKAGEFVLGYVDETGDLPPIAAARGAGPQRHLRGLPQAAPARGGLPPVPARARRRARPRRSCWPPSSSGAGPAARRWRWPRSRTTPSWAPTRSATTPSCTATTRAASSARSARTPGG